jgi:beta-ureidopropionase
VSGRAQQQVAPYLAVGLSTVVHGIGSRRDIERNLQIVEDAIHAAVSIIDIPGPETDRLAALARQYDTYIVAQCKARWPEVISERFFNTLFVISRQGELVHKAAKNHLWCRERSCVPHDVYDR